MAKNWSTRDLLLAAALGAAFGVLYQGANLSYAVYKSFLGEVLSNVGYGLWVSAGVAVPYVLRRPGSAVAGEMLAGFTSMLLGSQWGAEVLLSALAQGLGCEAVFALTGWKRYSLPVVMLAGASGCAAAFVHDYLVYGFAELAGALVAATAVIMIVSGALLGGLFAKSLMDALLGAGVLDNTPLGRESQSESGSTSV
ncbi:MAG: ECF transporter S component [Armatimonadota bacterium]